MSTILEALQNAEYNLRLPFTAPLAGIQLHNAVTLLEKGYGIGEEIEPFFDRYDAIEDVPDKEVKNENKHL
jgi:hypothetical protein